MQLIDTMTEVFRNPPIPYEPAKHSLKAWATYCLRDRGFKVVYAEKADFAVEGRTFGKVYFSVTTHPEVEPTPNQGWIVWDAGAQRATVIAPEA